MIERYPMQLQPVGKDYLWGGERLRTHYHKDIPLHPLAESWELSCHRDGQSIIANGSLAGTVLHDYLRRDWAGLLGTRGGDFAEFPILFKLIDAAQPLSVQVHPDDDYALRTEGEYGKTEMWVVLEAEPEATLLFGLNRALTPTELRERIADNTLPEVLRQVRVTPGDVVFVPPGTLHAIGAGIVIAEIQQNSNTTYRVYDYGRVGADGSPRPLHVQKALEVASLAENRAPVSRAFCVGETVRQLASCRYFTVSALQIACATPVAAGAESFVGLFCATGAGWLTHGGEKLPFRQGDTFFLPAGLGEVTVDGSCTILQMCV